MYSFSKHGKHLNNSITMSKLRVSIVIAKHLIVHSPVPSLTTCSPFIYKGWNPTLDNTHVCNLYIHDLFAQINNCKLEVSRW
jgi:hypothetical protein